MRNRLAEVLLALGALVAQSVPVRVEQRGRQGGVYKHHDALDLYSKQRNALQQQPVSRHGQRRDR
jgi:hypothetical protein